MATALNDGKLTDMFDYHESARRDPENEGLYVKTGVLSIANPNHGKDSVEIDENVTFHVKTIFTKNRNAWKVLSTLINKTVMQEELSDNDTIDLLILPDMEMGKDMEMPIKALMSMIIVLIGYANIPDPELKQKIVLCETRVLARFFKDKELSEMIEMLKTQSRNPKITRILEEYGPGFDEIYKDGIVDGRVKEKLDIARKLLREGVDEQLIIECAEISIKELEELKDI